jgi:ParB family chromosome partitioning protein
LPPKAERCWGEPEDGDCIGFTIDPRTGGIDRTVFRPHASEKPMYGGGKQCSPIAYPVARPDITKKGIEQIGDFRTEALHRGLQEAEFDDAALIGLLVLALAAENVEVRGDTGSCASRARIAATITEGGALTSDLAILRQAGRDLLRQVLNCSKGWHGSGLVARIAGEAIGADQYLPNMADDEFLKTLSKAGIQRTAREAGVPVLPQTAKEIRAALLRHVGQGRFVLPQARFALTEAEVAVRDAAKNVESGSSDIGLDDWEESFPEQESNEADIAFHFAAA